MNTGAKVALGLGTLAMIGMGALCAGAVASSGGQAERTILTTPTGPESPRGFAGTPKGKPPTSVQLKAGTWEVGSEVKAGTYTTTVGGDSFGCYWARLKNFEGSVDSIIANGNLDTGQRGRLTVKSTDKGLELTGDCVWTRQ